MMPPSTAAAACRGGMRTLPQLVQRTSQCTLPSCSLPAHLGGAILHAATHSRLQGGGVGHSNHLPPRHAPAGWGTGRVVAGSMCHLKPSPGISSERHCNCSGCSALVGSTHWQQCNGG